LIYIGKILLGVKFLNIYCTSDYINIDIWFFVCFGVFSTK